MNVLFVVTEFRDCFSLFAKEKYITNADMLATIMRSLAFSPTTTEVQKYFAEYGKGQFLSAFEINEL